MSLRSSPYSSLASAPVLWVVAMAWHLGRILMGRPAFERLADAPSTVLSFVGVYFFASWLRWVDVGGGSLASFAGTQSLYGLLIVALVERKDRSSALAATLLGSSAAVDLIAVALHLGGGFPLNHLLYVMAEFVLMAVCVFRFSTAPSSVRARGYRPSPFSSRIE